jgi:predicted DNA-binding transcriptional regulator AlpA
MENTMDQKQPEQTAQLGAQENSQAGVVASRSLLLTAAEAAAIFRKSARSWRNWNATGKIPRPIRIGRSTFWRPEEIEAWLSFGCPDRESWEQQKRDREASDCPEKSAKRGR